MSATHVENVDAFIDEVNQTLADELGSNVSLVIGGQAVENEAAESLHCDRVTRRLVDLETYLEELGVA